MKETSSSSIPSVGWQELKSKDKILYVATVVYKEKKYTVQTAEADPEIRKVLLECISKKDDFLSRVSEQLVQGEKKHAFVPFSIREAEGSRKAEISEPLFQESLATDGASRQPFFTLEGPPPPPEGISPEPPREFTYSPSALTMDKATDKRFQRFRGDRKQTLFLFMKNDKPYLVEKKEKSLVYREIDMPSPGSPVRMTPYLKQLLSTNPQKVNDFLNRAKNEGKTFLQGSIDKKTNLVCVTEADGSFSILAKVPELETAYIVAGGAMLLSPSESSFRRTLTIKVGDSYVKVRNILVHPRASTAQWTSIHPDNWLSLGSGEFGLVVSRKALLTELEKLPPKTKTEVLSLLSSFSGETEVLPVAPGARKAGEVATPVFAQATTFEERQKTWEKLQFEGSKITTVMSPDGELAVVASKKLGEGAFKVVKKVQLLWIGKETDIAKIGAEVALAKSKRQTTEGGSPEYWKEQLLAEIPIAKRLKDVPFTLSMREVKRADSAKAGIWLELCEEGDLVKYTDKNPSPEIRKQLMIQLAKGLVGMHQKGLVHSDMKPSNVLVTNTADGLQVRIIDFGFTRDKGTTIEHIAGTFPPPQFMDEYNKQTREKRTGIELTESVDAWAFGLTLFAFMKNEDVNGFSFEQMQSMAQPKEMHDKIQQKIGPYSQSDDPVDRAIRGLLDMDHPITLEEALVILEEPPKDTVQQQCLPQDQAKKLVGRTIISSLGPDQPITPQGQVDSLGPSPQFIKISTSSHLPPQPLEAKKNVLFRFSEEIKKIYFKIRKKIF